MTTLNVATPLLQGAPPQLAEAQPRQEGELQGRAVTFPFLGALPPELQGNVLDDSVRMTLRLTDKYHFATMPHMSRSFFAKTAMKVGYANLVRFGLEELSISPELFYKHIPTAAERGHREVVCMPELRAGIKREHLLHRGFLKWVGEEWVRNLFPQVDPEGLALAGYIYHSNVDAIQAMDFEKLERCVSQNPSLLEVMFHYSNNAVFEGFERHPPSSGSRVPHLPASQSAVLMALNKNAEFFISDSSFDHHFLFPCVCLFNNVKLVQKFPLRYFPFSPQHLGHILGSLSFDVFDLALETTTWSHEILTHIIPLSEQLNVIGGWLSNFMSEQGTDGWLPRIVSEQQEGTDGWLSRIMFELRKRQIPFNLADLRHATGWADYASLKDFLENDPQSLPYINFSKLLESGQSDQKYAMIQLLFEQPDLPTSAIIPILLCPDATPSQRRRAADHCVNAGIHEPVMKVLQWMVARREAETAIALINARLRDSNKDSV